MPQGSGGVDLVPSVQASTLEPNSSSSHFLLLPHWKQSVTVIQIQR
jgi:hypothetical protein